MLKDQLERVHQRIHHACQRSGRDASSVTLVCVSKGIPAEVIREAAGLGVTDIGENRVQEVRAKHARLNVDPPSVVRWHLVGHLQRNKAKDAVELFEVIHSVDSVKIAQELERQAAKRGQGARGKGRGTEDKGWGIEVFIQVNVSGEATKFGCRPEDAVGLVRAVRGLPHLRLRGLMTVAPFSDNPEDARPHFRRLRLLRDELQASVAHSSLITRHSSLLLSMGMSHDFEVAIEEGADLVRIGSAIFGDT